MVAMAYAPSSTPEAGAWRRRTFTSTRPIKIFSREIFIRKGSRNSLYILIHTKFLPSVYIYIYVHIYSRPHKIYCKCLGMNEWMAVGGDRPSTILSRMRSYGSKNDANYTIYKKPLKILNYLGLMYNGPTLSFDQRDQSQA